MAAAFSPSKVFGKSEDVEESDVAYIDPPETFEFFLTHDITISDSGEQVGFDANMAKKPPSGGVPSGHIVPQDTHLKLAFSVAQADKHFKVCELGRVQVDNWRDDENKPVAAGWGTSQQWTSLQISKQGRASDAAPWMAQCEWTKLPDQLNDAGAADKIYFVDLKAEVNEVELLGLDEPLGLSKTMTVKIVGKGKSGAKKFDEKEHISRQRTTSIVNEVYMGQFEVQALQVAWARAHPEAAKEVFGVEWMRANGIA